MLLFFIHIHFFLPSVSISCVKPKKRFNNQGPEKFTRHSTVCRTIFGICSQRLGRRKTTARVCSMKKKQFPSVKEMTCGMIIICMYRLAPVLCTKRGKEGIVKRTWQDSTWRNVSPILKETWFRVVSIGIYAFSLYVWNSTFAKYFIYIFSCVELNWSAFLHGGVRKNLIHFDLSNVQFDENILHLHWIWFEVVW